ncbi:ABC transporter type 1, transmembrane domain-containing protein [Mycena sp. CBHHK59/15]|nr:ABC transporter type 1, transmembrane domain-containing protein [Mycena sp. CBHHK59/15]
MELCTSSSPFHLGDPCVRSSWSAIAPAFLVLVFLATSLPITVPARFRKYCRLLRTSFATYLPLHEAEALDLASVDSPPSLVNVVDVESPLLHSLLFVFAGLFESLVWVADASFYLILSPFDAWGAGRRLLVAFSWMYTAVRPITHPSATAPYDLFSIYVLHFIGGFLLLAGHVFEHTVSGTPLPSTMVLFGLSVNLAVIVTLLYVTVKMPIGLPSTFVRKEDIGYSVSPEDYTSLFGWITFSWVYSLIQRGTNTTLEEKDVWTLSPTNQSRPLFTKFQNLRGASLLRRLWAANSLDILLDFFGTLGSVIFQYAGPFFLKRLLDSIDRPDRTSKDKGIAYNYAGLMFLCSVVKALFDAQHLWYGQRAATRIRSELMAAIYDKTLKRKDFSGIIHKEKVQQATASGPSGGNTPKAKAKAEDNVPSAGADTGKIVNLMSGDAERIATITNSMYFVYGAPLEFTIGFMFLYQLLGWSAFSGFIAIIAGWPLNNYLAERNSRINKGILKAKDKRMGEVNELLGAFVKFFSWEEMWIGRAMHARDEEMAWRLKGRINNVFFQCVWSITPILLSIISFFTYVALGNKLTIAKAFTAIALFAMIRVPLNNAPIYLVEMIQARIAVDRIAVFLGEAEVTDQVSSLKKDFSEPELPGSEDDALGLENASFKWNDVEVVDEEHDSTVDADSTSSYSDRRFELKDVSVLFPEGALTVVTGPTASGKTALLMGVLGK